MHFASARAVRYSDTHPNLCPNFFLVINVWISPYHPAEPYNIRSSLTRAPHTPNHHTVKTVSPLWSLIFSNLSAFSKVIVFMCNGRRIVWYIYVYVVYINGEWERRHTYTRVCTLPLFGRPYHMEHSKNEMEWQTASRKYYIYSMLSNTLMDSIWNVFTCDKNCVLFSCAGREVKWQMSSVSNDFSFLAKY